jgi:hypothetical protein
MWCANLVAAQLLVHKLLYFIFDAEAGKKTWWWSYKLNHEHQAACLTSTHNQHKHTKRLN